MNPETLLLFFFTVFPLICTPGPDIIFTASQGFSLGRVAAMRAVMGVLLGYTAHALLSAIGIAAIVATSPYLFTILKWVGVIYLFYLAGQILFSAFQTKNGITIKKKSGFLCGKVFLPVSSIRKVC